MMRMNIVPPSLFPLPETTISQQLIAKNIITDQWSKYTAVADVFTSGDSHKSRITQLKSDKYFAKATHNSYAWRVKSSDWLIIEWRNDDGETGAWQVILRELQRVNAVNMILVITRYYGWVKLYGERFRHVVDASRIVLEKIK